MINMIKNKILTIIMNTLSIFLALNIIIKENFKIKWLKKILKNFTETNYKI